MLLYLLSQKIRQKVFEQIKLEDLTKETGYKTLLVYLDNI